MIIPIMHCTMMARSVAFYTSALDFKHVGSWPENGDPSFTILERHGFELHLSSHGGDGKTGNVIAIIVKGVDSVFAKLLSNGLIITVKAESPVHNAPVFQTWGTKEFYVDDPDGNTIRFVMR
jgi:catechol 2,3-dioxygenase-like lactoylglutathione lyase family enzyme